mgnify:FL=1
MISDTGKKGKIMNRKGKRAGGRIAAAVCTATLSAGLILPSVSHAPIVRTVRAEERSEKTQELLKAGNYVEGEALVVTADSETTTYIYKENPLLDQSEEIFTLDSETDHLESKVSSPVKAPQETKPDQIKGTIKLVKSSTMSTKELIESLYEDPDVLYAEPNYISASAENHSSSHRIKENEKSNSSHE